MVKASSSPAHHEAQRPFAGEGELADAIRDPAAHALRDAARVVEARAVRGGGDLERDRLADEALPRRGRGELAQAGEVARGPACDADQHPARDAGPKVQAPQRRVVALALDAAHDLGRRQPERAHLVGDDALEPRRRDEKDLHGGYCGMVGVPVRNVVTNAVQSRTALVFLVATK
jgi:hypothetical protein